MPRPTAVLRELFDAAVEAASPAVCMQRWMPARPSGRVVVIGAGKAAAAMAAELERQWGPGLEGLVIVPYGHGVACRDVEVAEAGHPVPDDNGVAATRRIVDRVSRLGPDDTVVCLFSGGGSALLCLPAPGITLGEKQAITADLLRSGAPIHEINARRRELSAVKGGKLAAACAPAHVVTLLISDVPGNDPAVVASGPTILDAAHGLDEDVHILATSDDALQAAAARAQRHGLTPYVLGDLRGDARELAREHARLALAIADGRGPVEPPSVILSGGETTVRVTGRGIGGRNGEYGLALALALDGHPRVFAIACDTDGIDGGGDNAGVVVTPDVLARARALGLDAIALQADNDSRRFFGITGDLVTTGPTRTNVNDFRAVLVH